VLDFPSDFPLATLYMENVRDELYEAVRERARAHGKSIAAEVISLLEEGIPTRAEFARREKFLKRVISMRSRKPASGPFRSAEKMLREDRLR
jgi:plasmid stability protein